jgi:hypothetical protein
VLAGGDHLDDVTGLVRHYLVLPGGVDQLPMPTSLTLRKSCEAS